MVLTNWCLTVYCWSRTCVLIPEDMACLRLGVQFWKITKFLSIASAIPALSCYCEVLGKCGAVRSKIFLQRKLFSCSVLSQCLDIFYNCGTTITNKNDSCHLSNTLFLSLAKILYALYLEFQRNTFRWPSLTPNHFGGKLRQGALRNLPNVILLPRWGVKLWAVIWYCQNLWQTLTNTGIGRACGRSSHTP